MLCRTCVERPLRLFQVGEGVMDQTTWWCPSIQVGTDGQSGGGEVRVWSGVGETSGSVSQKSWCVRSEPLVWGHWGHWDVTFYLQEISTTFSTQRELCLDADLGWTCLGLTPFDPAPFVGWSNMKCRPASFAAFGWIEAAESEQAIPCHATFLNG